MKEGKIAYESHNNPASHLQCAIRGPLFRTAGKLAALVLLTAGVACSPQESYPSTQTHTPVTLTPTIAPLTPTPDQFTQEQIIGERLLEWANSIVSTENTLSTGFAATGEHTTHTIIIPEGEVDPNEIDLEFAQRTIQFFEAITQIHYEGHTLDVETPTTHTILIVNRSDSPQILLDRGEVTLNSGTQLVSFINLQGPQKIGGRPFSNTWSTFQAICLGYAPLFSGISDPLCNVSAATAAASWNGLPPEHVENLGTTRLAGEFSTTDTDLPYSVIPQVWDFFQR